MTKREREKARAATLRYEARVARSSRHGQARFEKVKRELEEQWRREDEAAARLEAELRLAARMNHRPRP